MSAITVETNAGVLAVRYEHASRVFAKNLTRTLRQVERELKASLRLTLRAAVGRVSGRMHTVRGRFLWPTEQELAAGTREVTLAVRSKAWYAGVHERGATQTPRRAAHLTIPLAGADNSGRGAVRWNDGTRKVSAFTAREVIDAPGRYGFTGTFTRNGVIFGRLLEHDDIVPLFALVRSTTLRARWPHKTTREVMAPRVRELLGAAVSESTAAVAAGREAAA